MTLRRPPHPFVRLILSKMRDDHLTYAALGKLSGLTPSTIHHWNKVQPRLHNIEAVLNALGYRLKIVPIEEEDGP